MYNLNNHGYPVQELLANRTACTGDRLSIGLYLAQELIKALVYQYCQHSRARSSYTTARPAVHPRCLEDLLLTVWKVSDEHSHPTILPQ